jgi:hypothetical protein
MASLPVPLHLVAILHERAGKKYIGVKQENKLTAKSKF